MKTPALRIASFAIIAVASSLLQSAEALAVLQTQSADSAPRDSTFSSTPESEAATRLIQALKAGNLEDFRAILGEKTLGRYGSESGMRELQKNFELRSGGADLINYKTHLASTLQKDTFGGIVIHRARSVDVLGSTQGTQQATILRLSVNCANGMILEYFLKDRGCKVDIVETSESRDGVSDSRDGALANVSGKYLGSDSHLATEGAGTSRASGTDANGALLKN